MKDANDEPRPTTRGECGELRPCPYVSCRHHLFLDVDDRKGRIKYNWPDLEVWELKESCSLDVADRGAITDVETATRMGFTRQNADHLEKRGIRKLRDLARRFPKSAWAQSVAHLLQLMTGDQNAKR